MHEDQRSLFCRRYDPFGLYEKVQLGKFYFLFFKIWFRKRLEIHKNCTKNYAVCTVHTTIYILQERKLSWLVRLQIPATSHSCHFYLQEICFSTYELLWLILPSMVGRSKLSVVTTAVYLSFRVTVTQTKAVFLANRGLMVSKLHPHLN